MISIHRSVVLALCAVGLVLGACDKKDSAAPAAAKPTGSAASTAAAPAASAAKPAAKPAGSAAVAKKAPPAALKKPVPTDWITMRDNTRGFEFQVPEGTKDSQTTTPQGVTVYGAQLPAPNNDIAVVVVAYKDAAKTKDDLFNDVDDILQAMKQTNVKVGEKREIDANYSVADVTWTDDDGKTPDKGKALVATDVTDNYLMIVGGSAAAFGTEEATIDEIIGSLQMDSDNSP